MIDTLFPIIHIHQPYAILVFLVTSSDTYTELCLPLAWQLLWGGLLLDGGGLLLQCDLDVGGVGHVSCDVVKDKCEIRQDRQIGVRGRLR